MISVCIATFNGEKFIADQINSICCQIGMNDEIIISDNNSTDNTLNIITSIDDKRIKIYKHKSNITKHDYSASHFKVTENFENALNKANGDYIFLADQDDIWEPDKVATILPFLQKGYIIQSNYSVINGESKIVEPCHFIKSPIKNKLILNLVRQPFHGCCMAFPKSLLEKALPFPKDLIMHDNWLGLIGQMYGYEIKYIEEPLIRYRRYFGNVSPTNSNNPLWFKISYRIKIFLQLLTRTKIK